MVVLRLLAAAGLAVSAALHLELAEQSDLIGETITLGTLFRAQAVVALLVAVWLLVRRHDRLPVLAALAVAAGSLAALVLSTYVSVPAIGPLPPLYDPIWYSDKVLAALSAAVATVAAAVLLAPRQRHRVP